MMPGITTVPLLAKRIKACESLDSDMLVCAHLTAALLAPKDSFVTVSPITKEIRVCIRREPITMKDVIWEGWPAWRLRWMAGTLDAAFGLVDQALPGVDFTHQRRAVPMNKPPYTCVLTAPGGAALGRGEHVDTAAAVVLALLDTLSPTNRAASLRRQPAAGTA